MQYQLPQFIEVEDKIIGPFTFRQFVYLAGGGGLFYVIFAVCNQIIGIPLIISLIIPTPIALLALALAFYRVNNRPFIFTLESAFKYYTNGKLYLWKKEVRETKEARSKEPSTAGGVMVPTLSGSKLRDMGWNLDVSADKHNSPQQPQ